MGLGTRRSWGVGVGMRVFVGIKIWVHTRIETSAPNHPHRPQLTLCTVGPVSMTGGGRRSTRVRRALVAAEAQAPMHAMMPAAGSRTAEAAVGLRASGSYTLSMGLPLV